MNLIKKTAIALSLFAFTGSSVAFAQTKTPTKKRQFDNQTQRKQMARRTNKETKNRQTIIPT